MGNAVLKQLVQIIISFTHCYAWNHLLAIRTLHMVTLVT